MNVILNLVKEVLLAMVFKVAWKVVLERALTRVIIASLRWLAKLTTNNVDDQTVEDIIVSLKGKRLKVIDDPSQDPRLKQTEHWER